ncbi:MAG: RNA degradosome polyphosphate kinase, partial [Eubacterium sp.]|nr:RNA degradosome polyphosphate kinase [Eubacterium sp.]
MEEKITERDMFFNRELSWLDFDDRILSEAKDNTIPLMERLKFLSITSSNLDEFFMVRVASLKDQVNAGYKGLDIAGMTAIEQINAILDYTHDFVERQYTTYNRSFIPMLKTNGLKIISYFEDLNDEQSEYVDKYFSSEVFPVLTPMAVDSSRPFPLIRNKYLNICALLQDKKDKNTVDFATVQVPSGLPRVVTIPTDEDNCTTVILLEQIIEKNIHRLFTGYKVLCATPYRVMRNADLPFDEDEAADLLVEIEKQLKRRQWGEPIRLEVESGIDKQLLKILK